MGEGTEHKTSINELERWIEEYGPRLFLYAQQQTSCYADAQDVYQDALIEVIQKAKNNGAKEIPELGKFFLTIKHRSIDLYRSRNQRYKREEKFGANDQSVWFERIIESDEKAELLQQAIRSLPVDQQEVLVLKIWGELTFKTISENLGLSLNTVASRYRYALNQLKSTLQLQLQ